VTPSRETITSESSVFHRTSQARDKWTRGWRSWMLKETSPMASEDRYIVLLERIDWRLIKGRGKTRDHPMSKLRHRCIDSSSELMAHCVFFRSRVERPPENCTPRAPHHARNADDYLYYHFPSSSAVASLNAAIRFQVSFVGDKDHHVTSPQGRRISLNVRICAFHGVTWNFCPSFDRLIATLRTRTTCFRRLVRRER